MNIIKNEKNLIGVDKIRDLIEFMSLKTTVCKKKVAIINGAASMSTAATNALLKTLEEPEQNKVIILTESFYCNILPTIESRVVELSLKPNFQDQSLLSSTKINHDLLPYYNTACYGLSEMGSYIDKLKHIEEDFSIALKSKSLTQSIQILDKHTIDDIILYLIICVTRFY